MKRLTNPVTLLALVQLFFIGGGYLFTRAMLRIWDKMYGLGTSQPGMLWIPRVVAAYGLWPALLTILWCIMAALATGHGDDEGGLPRPMLVCGILLTAGVALSFALSMLGSLVAVFGR